MFARFFSSLGRKKQAYELYGKLVSQARQPDFYTGLGVADTIDGRFDMILLHLFLVDWRLRADGDGTEPVRRNVQEALIADMDRSLRELGVGDMSVGKEVKKMGAAWFGRLKTYQAAMAGEDAKGALTTAIAKNVYRQDDAPNARVLADYVLAACQKLADVPLSGVVACEFEFPAIPADAA